MKKFIATTKTGTTYESDGHTILVTPGDPRQVAAVYKPIRMKSVDRKTHLFPFVALPEVELPVVGESIYFESMDGWRLSTPVASFEVLD